MRFQIIRNARIENAGKSQSCMVSKLRIIWKQTVLPAIAAAGAPLPMRDLRKDKVSGVGVGVRLLARCHRCLMNLPAVFDLYYSYRPVTPTRRSRWKQQWLRALV